MPSRSRFWSWWYKLGLGGTCQVCHEWLTEAPEKLEGKRVCLSCAERIREKLKSKGLLEIVLEQGLILLVQGFFWSEFGSWMTRVFKGGLVVAALGGVGFLLYLAVTQAHLPLLLAVLLGGMVLVASFFMLWSPRPER